MFSLPESTVFGRKIPKQVFYEKADVTAAVKRLFVDYVDNIIWQNKLSPNTSTSRGTIPVSKGKNVIEIEVIELQLKSDLKNLSDLLSVMDKATPHHAVFIVTLLEESQIWIGYKEIMVTNSVKEFKVTEPVYFHTDWQKRKTLGLFLEGMSIDDVYENLIRYLFRSLLIKDEFDEGDKYTHTLYTWVDDAGTLDLSIEVPSLGGQSSSKGNWICFNNVRLTYYFSPEDLGPYVTQLEEAVAAAEALDLPTTQREILDAVVDEYNKAWSTISEYETAISAIEDATTTAQAYVAPYAAYKSLRGNINTSLIGKTSKYTDPSDATSAYNSVLSAQNAAVEGAVTTDAISNAQSTLWSAAAAWMKSVSINPGAGFDLTWMIQNSDFSDIDYKKAWDETLVSGTTAGVTNGVMRYYQSDFDLSQTLPYTLPAGSYTLTMDGFERTNSPMNTAYPDYTGGTSIVTGTFYLNSNENLVMNLFDVQSVTDNSKGGARPTGASFYIPDGSSAAKKYIDAGLYPNTLNAVLGEDAAVTIGYRCANTKAWTCVDNFHLEYNGTPVSATLGTNGYSTFASPYPLDLTNLPDGLTAYKAAVDGSTVTFTELDQAVPAYTGILLKGDESASYDIPVAGAGTIVSDNAFCVNEAGTTFSPESGYNYFGLKKNTLTFGLFDPSAVAIPADKAYLKVSEGAGARLDISFDGEAPTGISAFAETEDGVQQDGKFLEDGQIVIVRNGVKYRANGQIVK